MLRPGCGHALATVCIWGEGVLLVGTDHPLGKDDTSEEVEEVIQETVVGGTRVQGHQSPRGAGSGPALVKEGSSEV